MDADTALFDACVLYPAPLRDLLVELAYRRLIRARWTAEIHEEWMRNLQANRPDIEPGRLERTRVMMDRVRGCLVTGHLDLASDDRPTEVGRLARVLNTMLARIERAFAERDATETELRYSEERMRRFVADAAHDRQCARAGIMRAVGDLLVHGFQCGGLDAHHEFTFLRRGVRKLLAGGWSVKGK